MKVLMFPVSDVLVTGMNPDGRDDAKYLHELEKSIREHGILQPLLVNGQHELIDGHRRLVCAKAVGLHEVPCIITQGDAKTLFKEANSTQRKITPQQWGNFWLKGGDVPPQIKSNIDNLIRVIGEQRTCELLRDGMSPSLWAEIRRLSLYCGDESRDFVLASIRWLQDRKMRLYSRRAMLDAVPVPVLKAAILSNTSIKPVWDTETNKVVMR